jgi:DNA-binding MarR family transcriptional regulator
VAAQELVAYATNSCYPTFMGNRVAPAPAEIDELRRVTQRFFRRFGTLSSESTPCGKPLAIGHAHALMVLLGQGALTQQALGRELFIDKSNVARLCAKMIDAGHVQQRAREDDGRSRVVSLTARGAKLAREVEAASRARFGALLGALPVARRAEVIRAVQYLVQALDATCATSVEEARA